MFHMVGGIINSYRLERKLGEGGMGEVYLAAHQLIDRRAAVKLLLAEHSQNVKLVQRFLTEARATARIRHPGIVEVLDCGIHPGGRAFLVMELLDGQSLRQWLASGERAGPPKELTARLDIAAQIASALGAAHRQGIVHRDLKPDNVLLLAADDGRPRVKVLDFGIAKLLGEMEPSASGTGTGVLLGTPLYMSPEQCEGLSRAVDFRSDIYSFGCLLFELVTGRPPFRREGFTSVLIHHLRTPPPRPADINPLVPGELEELILECLAKRREDRPSSADEVLARLLDLGATLPWTELTLPPPVARKARAGRRRFPVLRRPRALIAAAGTAAAAAVAAAVLLLGSPDGAAGGHRSRSEGARVSEPGASAPAESRAQNAAGRAVTPGPEAAFGLLVPPGPLHRAGDPAEPPAPSALAERERQPQLERRATPSPSARPRPRGPARAKQRPADGKAAPHAPQRFGGFTEL
jgi:tRNA A-37 threonylcarbamoyl transferase component Bud32